MTSDDFSRLLNAHGSFRSFKSRPVDPALVDRALHEMLQGAWSSVNTNIVSGIKTCGVHAKGFVLAESKSATAS